ncbi:MAG: ABC transporter permease [Clostridia bacterium]|nr:ABC transporter permease [Clostridia bacterium]MBQ2274671.1 ABC transporter permease [Clostridia bacterium]MBQ5901219.1 ABC transporter permease [Clostridia bacterium]
MKKDTQIKKNPLSLQLDLSSFEKATDEEKFLQQRMRESTTFFKDGMKRLSKNKIAMISLAVITLIVLIAIFVPMFYPYDYGQQLGIVAGQDSDSSYNNLRPFEYGETELKRIEAGEKIFPHIFGTDAHGRDYAIRVIYGTRISLVVGFFASIIVLIIGVIYGSISGYYGGKVDLIMMRIVDIIYSLPDLLMIILLSVVLKQTLTPVIEGTPLGKLGTGMISIFIVFALLYWVSMARLIRGQILSIKQQDYVLNARSIGAKSGHIIRRHMLPNCISVIIISTALQIPSAIFTESFLSFLGLGVAMPMPSLGSLASDALSGIYSYAYRLIIPAITICLIVLSLNLLGDGLRDAFDPKLKK